MCGSCIMHCLTLDVHKKFKPGHELRQWIVLKAIYQKLSVQWKAAVNILKSTQFPYYGGIS